ncbi:thioesterase II family protein [Actinoplanes philippinensis]|uniref:thioesterase II family protein n=1 Tax=Actinoplanes philippinensis TaxID=35752 RepID=UPI0033DF3ED6
MTSRWLWYLPRSHRISKIGTLVLLPHSGSSAQGYGYWSGVIPETVSVAAVQYPGRGSRFGEPAARDITDLADELAHETAGLEPPVHVFGHSLGALVGFELCWRLQQLGRPAAAFYPSAAAAADLHRPILTGPEALTDDRLLQTLRERGGMGDDVLNDPDLLEFALDICRADMLLTETYRYGPADRRLDCPITGFGGDRDPAVPTQLLHGWTRLGAAGSTVSVLPGGHFYLLHHLDTVATAITGRMGVPPVRCTDTRRVPR